MDNSGATRQRVPINRGRPGKGIERDFDHLREVLQTNGFHELADVLPNLHLSMDALGHSALDSVSSVSITHTLTGANFYSAMITGIALGTYVQVLQAGYFGTNGSSPDVFMCLRNGTTYVPIVDSTSAMAIDESNSPCGGFIIPPNWELGMYSPQGGNLGDAVEAAAVYVTLKQGEYLPGLIN